MSIYVNIANAIDPTREKLEGASIPATPVAIDQNTLVGKIDSIITDHGIGQHLVDELPKPNTDRTARECHAFAVGVVKRTHSEADPTYRLFRTYHPPPKARHPGPDPTKCKVSLACAATAAAQDFLQECDLEKVDGMKYWDDSFPRTHNVSCLALDEAESLFGAYETLDFVLNISPGIPSPEDIKQLQRTASKNSSTSSKRGWKVRKIFMPRGLAGLARRPTCPQIRAATIPMSDRELRERNRLDDSTGTSYDAHEKERGHQYAIKQRLKEQEQRTGRNQIYFRLELTAQGGEKPYLDDIAKPDRAMQLAHKFLEFKNTKDTISRLADNLTPQFEPRTEGFVTDRPLEHSPASSIVDFTAPSAARVAECHA